MKTISGINITGGSNQIGAAAAGNHSTAVANDTHFINAGSVGFCKPEDKVQFTEALDELRSLLRELKLRVESAPHLSEDERDRWVSEILQQVRGLNEAKTVVLPLPEGKRASDSVSTIVKESLDKTTTILDEITSVTDKAAEVGNQAVAFGKAIAPLVAKILPLAVIARHSFGIP